MTARACVAGTRLPDMTRQGMWQCSYVSITDCAVWKLKIEHLVEAIQDDLEVALLRIAPLPHRRLVLYLPRPRRAHALACLLTAPRSSPSAPGSLLITNQDVSDKAHVGGPTAWLALGGRRVRGGDGGLGSATKEA